jgi:hypothetical protein
MPPARLAISRIDFGAHSASKFYGLQQNVLRNATGNCFQRTGSSRARTGNSTLRSKQINFSIEETGALDQYFDHTPPKRTPITYWLTSSPLMSGQCPKSADRPKRHAASALALKKS